MGVLCKLVPSLILILGFTVVTEAGKYIKNGPFIYTESNERLTETVVDSQHALILMCEGKNPLMWTYPNNTVGGEPIWDYVTVKTTEVPGSTFPHLARLELHNASYVNTGFYYCHERDVLNYTNIEEESSAKIYVYVRDPVHLGIFDDAHTAIIVHQYEKAVIPCRPTSPDVHVQLFKIGEDDPDAVKHYDPKIGFTIEANNLMDSGEYLCVLSNSDNNELEQIFTLMVMIKAHSVDIPVISDLSDGHTVVGKKLDLMCSVAIDDGVRFEIRWKVPSPEGIQNGRINISKTITVEEAFGESRLIIENSAKEDEGHYTCIVTDHSGNTNKTTNYIKIYGENEAFIEFDKTNNDFNLTVEAGENVTWSIYVNAHPVPVFTWYRMRKNEKEELMNSTRRTYMITHSHTNAYMKMEHVSIEDAGIYILNAKNKFKESDLKLQITVLEKPTVSIEIDDYHMIHSVSRVNCTAAAYPLANIIWEIQPCEEGCKSYTVLQNQTVVRVEGLTRISTLNITAKETGLIKCSAENSQGYDSTTVGFFVTDVENGIRVWRENGEDDDIAKGDPVTLICGASTMNFTNEIYWFKGPGFREIVPNNEEYADYTITKSNTKLSYKSKLEIANIKKTTTFSCKVNEISADSEQFQLKNYTVVVKDPRKPELLNYTMVNKTLQINVHAPTEMFCYFNGIPKPKVSWFKDDVLLTPSDRFKFWDRNQKLKFTYTKVVDEGKYKCRAENRMGFAEKIITLELKNKEGINVVSVIVIVTLAIMFLLVIIVLCVKVRKEKRLKRELKIAGLANFEKGNVDCLNPELGVDDQAELLPYDKKWEFPREKLKLGKQLGSGAFGVVMKAEAHGLIDEEQSTVVAVKMVKGNADPTGIKALASELKIMVHLGKHINVVNLLGACTKNVTKRELLVIVEYCRFGNLQNYLLRHRNNFINQIDMKTGTIDPTIGHEALERTFSVGSNSSSGHGGFTIPQNMVDYRVNSNEACVTGNTEMTSICMTPTSEESPILSNNSAQPEWRSNYNGDYKGHVRPISTSDLVQWAFQVARGMDYLATRKVLHGDLAARNILLAENNVVKICDFGLAKSMYKSDNYKKKGSGLLPVKWMAVESISDRIFSTQSDVWSFGIVLWEFFSLACTPYPGMEANEILYNKLVDGYRMEQPEYATNEIYQIMTDCWEKTPASRPWFSQLEERLGNILEEGVRKHYISLNDPYLLMNTQRLANNSDYLAMMSPPDYGNLASPTTNHYINHEPGCSEDPNKVPEDSSGYLCMRPTKAPDIFSPRVIDNENIFSFNLAAANKLKQKNLNSETGTGIELLPMLGAQNPDSDTEMSPNELKSRNNSPVLDNTANCISNPNYYKPPVINTAPPLNPRAPLSTQDAEEFSKETDEQNILKSTDNYVNMPKNKSALNSSKNRSQEILESGDDSPKLISFKETPEERFYVNNNARAWDVPTNV